MPTSLWTVWEGVVAQAPDALAFVDARDGVPLSRWELSGQARAWAATVPAELAPGQVVAFCDGNGLSWLTRFLALQSLGAVALPLDPALPPPQRAETAASLGAHWFVDAGERWQRLGTSTPPLPADHCLLKTTSGSTGQPQSLAFTSANMLADGRQIARTMGIQPADINLGAIPFGHSYGLGNLILPLIEQGTALVASTEILPDALAAQIECFGATVLPSVPAVLRALAEASVEPARLQTLRRVVSAGAPLRPEVAVAFRARFRLSIQNFYGSSETGGISFDRTGEATLTGRSVGAPLDGVAVSFDSENRVTVRSPAVVAGGEYTLADLGFLSDTGELTLNGRVTTLANIGGKKVSPLEVERTLRSLAGVSDAWVGVRTRETGGGDFLLAAVETVRPSSEIRHELATRLPLWQIPRSLWVTPHLPRTVRGKIDRQQLEARCLSEATTA